MTNIVNEEERPPHGVDTPTGGFTTPARETRSDPDTSTPIMTYLALIDNSAKIVKDELALIVSEAIPELVEDENHIRVFKSLKKGGIRSFYDLYSADMEEIKKLNYIENGKPHELNSRL